MTEGSLGGRDSVAGIQFSDQFSVLRKANPTGVNILAEVHLAGEWD
jgi:hypothetical protein